MDSEIEERTKEGICNTISNYDPIAYELRPKFFPSKKNENVNNKIDFSIQHVKTEVVGLRSALTGMRTLEVADEQESNKKKPPNNDFHPKILPSSKICNSILIEEEPLRNDESPGLPYSGNLLLKASFIKECEGLFKIRWVSQDEISLNKSGSSLFQLLE